MDARRYLKQNDSGRIVRGHSQPRNRQKGQWGTWVKRTLIAGYWVALGGVVGSGVWVLPTIREWLDRPIVRVGVSGTMRYLDRTDLQLRLMPLVKNTFFQTDLAVIQKTLQADSWISSAEVRKIWPDTVEIVLEEQQPIARWRNTDMINADGEILRGLQGHDFSTLPALGGPGGRELEVMQQYQALSHHLRPLGLKVVGVDLSLSGDWSFTVDDVKVALGRADLIERIQHFARLYRVSLQPRWIQIESVDLRYRDGAAVAWRERNVVADNDG